MGEKPSRPGKGSALRRWFGLLRRTVTIWSDANASRMSAALSYYTMLSLAPLLVIAVLMAGLVFSAERAQRALVAEIAALSTPEVAATVEMVLANRLEANEGVVAGVASGVVLLFAASGVFSQLFDTMNVIWGVAAERRSGFIYTLRQRALGFAMALLVGLLLLASLLVSSMLTFVAGALDAWWPGLNQALGLLDASTTFLVLPLVFMALFRTIPLRPVVWGDVWLGGILTAVLFVLGRWALGLYLGGSTIATSYGAAGSLGLFLMWVYFSGLIIFMGAAFCKAYAETFGSLAAESAAGGGERP